MYINTINNNYEIITLLKCVDKMETSVKCQILINNKYINIILLTIFVFLNGIIESSKVLKLSIRKKLIKHIL